MKYRSKLAGKRPEVVKAALEQAERLHTQLHTRCRMCPDCPEEADRPKG